MAASAAQRLLAWYDRHRRTLPWRENSDPYRVWLSEIMLQQTRVETVIPYFHRFLERFPAVEDLAAAEIDEVLGLWSGLGYYRRARQLHAAAQAIARAGGFPRTLEGLKALPGIGDYTAAAVGSIAFGLAEPVVDGNVERVLGRYRALEEDPKSTAGRRILAAAAREMLDADRPGDSNQALMELGATLCKPKRPACLLCPLQEGCEARRRGEVDRFPPPRQRKASVEVRLVAAVVDGSDRPGGEDGRILLFRRPEDSSLLAGTWEVPWVEVTAPGEPRRAKVARDLAARYGGRWTLGDHRGQAKHGITFRSLTVEVHDAEMHPEEGMVAQGPEAGWFSEGEVEGLAVSSLVRKILRCRRPRKR